MDHRVLIASRVSFFDTLDELLGSKNRQSARERLLRNSGGLHDDGSSERNLFALKTQQKLEYFELLVGQEKLPVLVRAESELGFGSVSRSQWRFGCSRRGGDHGSQRWKARKTDRKSVV